MFAVKRSVAVTTALASALSVSAGVAHANKKMEEVLVEGRHLSMDKVNSVKTPTPIIDVPQSLSIFSAEQIAQQGVKSVRDIIDYSAG